LRERYGTLSRTARQAVGYRELLAWLDQGQPAERREEVVESVAAHTRQLARRQETWFRSFAEITPVDIEQESEWPMLLERLLEHLQRAGQQRAGQQRAALDR
jgi:tRNA dimethylallyltransferase